ncbi:restriction endonuclease [Planktothrix pseudagardhii]|uniref:Type-2 restriction enzyme BsuMI component YdiS n=1 Tax=Planktothrix pseudagardhii TaxID=132604 RepID=A0A9W4CTZ4_9CYAN|nr:restriction endonuclease [Planktothrix pseudagardhii]CAD5966201.1 Type-2 restriction enzyme BsuMI component YdiS [Planktothrix pseudagardhii]
MPNRPIQKILFGSPGTGKSHRVEKKIIPDELNITDQSNVIPTVFHPEYTYGDFMGKLMPLTDDSGKVEYKYYSGHFLKALAKAYKNIIISCIKYEKDKKDATEGYKKEINKTRLEDFSDEQKDILKEKHSKIIKQPKNVVLVIDEINRGNSAAIFGTVFQLLDRNKNGWSQYPITISDLEKTGLLQAISFKQYFLSKKAHFEYDGNICKEDEYNKYLDYIFSDLSEEERVRLQECKIKLPPNLSFLATMNTSDNSIYFMDSAFKRRWDWEFVNIDDGESKDFVSSRRVILYETDICAWNEFVDQLNKFICNQKTVRKIEDKQIGYFFIDEETITEEHIKNKLMFFIWDSVFSNNRKPLTKLLEMTERERDLVTFGQFTQKEVVQKFVEKIMEFEKNV